MIFSYVSGLLVTDETDCPDGRTPPLELVHPVSQGGLGDQDHVGTIDVPQVLHVAQQGDGLKGLAQTHLVCQDAVDAILCRKTERLLSTYCDSNLA